MPVLYVDKLSAYNGSVDYHTDFKLKFLRNFSNLNFLLQVIRFRKANQIKSHIKISVRNKLKLPLFYNTSLTLTSDNDVTKFESVYIFKAKISILEFLENAKINYLRKKKIKHLEFYKEKNVNNLRKNLLGMSEYSTREKNILCKNRIRSGFHVTEEITSNFKNNHSDFIYSAFKKRTSFIQEYRHNNIKAKGDRIQIKKGFKHFNSSIKIFRKYA